MTDTPPSVSPSSGPPRSTQARPGTMSAGEPPSGATVPPEPRPTTTPPPAAARPTARTRISTAWLGVVATALVIVLLLVFILQNTQSVKVSYFTANGHLPLGVALLLAAIGGVLLTAGVASLRILQLRRRANPGGRLAGHWRAGRHQVGA